MDRESFPAPPLLLQNLKQAQASAPFEEWLSATQKISPEREETRKFTRDGDVWLERHLDEICTSVLHGVRQIAHGRLEALLLGGGYGRGEGGVLKTPNGHRPYNDLEFYICLRGIPQLNRRRFGGKLDHLAEALTKNALVDIEFHIISLAQLRRAQPSMFYYDLVVGHQRLHGDASAFQHCEHHRDARLLPPAEATRLLMNRGTGLLFAKEKLARHILSATDKDFIARNIAKAQLALGDAVLTSCGQYYWSCLERQRRLATLPATIRSLPWFDELRHHHALGVEFKLHPYRSITATEVLRHDFHQISELMLQVWLWLESQRLQQNFSSARHYATSPVNKCPETNPWRNRLLNVWLFGPAILASPASHRHPRERIFHALTILLWDSAASENLLPAWLNLEATSVPTKGKIIEAYDKLWQRVR
jgi:hypothetical protein